MERVGVSLLSGGLDSTTVTAYARNRLSRLTALTFHYGQTHAKEIDCAREVAGMMDVQHELLDISGFARAAWYSSLTSPERFPTPKSPSREPGSGQAVGEAGPSATAIPISYVPLRNTFFITVAAAFLESQVLYAIEAEAANPEEVGAYIYLAPNAVDYSGYPDCRPEYYEKMREALMHGSKLWTQYGVSIDIETPIIQFSKAEIVRMGVDLKAPLERTWSCYEAGEVPCGGCDSCIFRARGFAQAGYPDPLLVRLGVSSP